MSSPWKLAAAAGIALLLSGCRPNPAPPAPAAAAVQAHHGGQLATGRFGAAELVSSPDGSFAIYVSSADGRPLSLSKASGSLIVALPNYADVPLSPSGDHLQGKGAPLPVAAPPAVLVLRTGEGTDVLRFAGSQMRPPPATDPGLEEMTAEVTDSMCLGHAAEGDAEARHECAVRCIHAGAEIALVDKATGRAFLATAAQGTSLNELLLPHVGYQVLVRGKRGSDAGKDVFEVREVYPVHDHAPAAGGAVGMAGDLHLEVLALRSGEVRVYLSDLFRHPIAVEGQRGEVELRGAEPKAAPLSPGPGNRALVGQLGALGTGPVELTVRLPLDGLGERYRVPRADAGAPFSMTFLVDPQDEGAPPTRGADPAMHGH